MALDQPSLFPSQGLNHQSIDSSVLHPLMGSFPNDLPRSQTGSPAASKAMLEANSRRRRHPAQFECEDCKQMFTALFSLKREFPRILLRGFNL